jgi:hypothetical protein
MSIQKATIFKILFLFKIKFHAKLNRKNKNTLLNVESNIH